MGDFEDTQDLFVSRCSRTQRRRAKGRIDHRERTEVIYLSDLPVVAKERTSAPLMPTNDFAAGCADIAESVYAGQPILKATSVTAMPQCAKSVAPEEVLSEEALCRGHVSLMSTGTRNLQDVLRAANAHCKKVAELMSIKQSALSNAPPQYLAACKEVDRAVRLMQKRLRWSRINLIAVRRVLRDMK